MTTERATAAWPALERTPPPSARISDNLHEKINCCRGVAYPNRPKVRAGMFPATADMAASVAAEWATLKIQQFTSTCCRRSEPAIVAGDAKPAWHIPNHLGNQNLRNRLNEGAFRLCQFDIKRSGQTWRFDHL